MCWGKEGGEFHRVAKNESAKCMDQVLGVVIAWSLWVKASLSSQKAQRVIISVSWK